MLDTNYLNSIEPNILQIAKKAGSIILKYYKQNYDITIKSDQSPVTQADIAANDYIITELEKLNTSIKIVSEETANEQFDNKATFFIIDPLDGTKSFINNSDDFTVNIGIIENGTPIFGVVYAPATDIIYYTENNKAYKQTKNQKPQQIHASGKQQNDNNLIVVASKSHLSQETKNFIERLDVKEFKSIGSSLKFCLIAEGTADIYPRFSPTMEWDTAAAHAVLIAAGGNVKTTSGSKFEYGKKDYLNGHFIAE